MTGYSLHPSREVQRLRAEFPEHLICELHDERGRPVFTATRARPCCPRSPDLVTAATPVALREALGRPSAGAR
ncbi:hypothetical protein [Nocardiopsis sp. FIRDI 009]|uniref:hypothetical protein n=1 Tax=Nocardiopsis sp. FIRDI 009 TaxID=714197 RepID=UPI000E239792|nr:hypothetical protein [Nocardiopsis sp. FIRDI 009]